SPASPAAAGGFSPTAGPIWLSRIAEVGQDLLGADPDLLWMELETECSHETPPNLVASRNWNGTDPSNVSCMMQPGVRTSHTCSARNTRDRSVPSNAASSWSASAGACWSYARSSMGDASAQR